MHIKKYILLLVFSLSSQFIFSQIVDSAQLVLSDKVLFEFGQYTITPAADATLAKIITQLDSLKNFEIRITAHTDAVGSNQNNRALSQNRANAVQAIFVQNGMSPEIITTKIFGEEKPETNNDTETGRQLNRRATIHVFKKIKLVSFQGQIKDDQTGVGIYSKVVIRTKEKRDSIITDTAGNFKTLLPLGAVAGIDVYAKDYFFETKMFKVKPNGQKEINFPLKKVAIGKKVDIKNLFFIGNKATLLKRSFPELPKLLKFMELNDSIKIEVAGHINRPNYPPVDKLSWDFKLSVQRAKMVHDYLLENDIPADRISYKGYGNFHMRYPKARNEKEQSENRRVEIRVVERS